MRCRGRSLPLERAFTDLSADSSFAEAVKKIKLHYGVKIASSTTRLDVLRHASNIQCTSQKYFAAKSRNINQVIISSADGVMTPIVTQKTDVNDSAGKADKRKTKQLEWREARLAMAREQGSVSPVFAAVLGSTEAAGEKIATVINMVGVADKHHNIGDGALWLAEQFDRVTGSTGSYLLDFYHVSEYLAKASECCAPTAKSEWRFKQESLLKANDAEIVLKNLKNHPEAPCSLKDKCHALLCYNYLSKRLHQLDYKSALEADLPIGSGEIESANRSIIQKRLKIPGAWWTIDNTNKMLHLRTLRANGNFETYFKDQFAAGGVVNAMS